MQVPPTDANASLLLRTPIASEADGGAIHPDDAKANGNTLKLGWQMLALGGHIESKLPNPTVSDQYTDNLKSSQQTDGSLHSVTLAQLVNRPDLLPTTTASDWKGANRSGSGSASSNGIATVAEKLLPTPLTTDYKQNGSPGTLARNSPQLGAIVHKTNWGRFAPAIHRWETVTGNPAPAPTIPDGRDGQHRLNPAFTEWLMGLEPGWITDVPITRNEQLKACGNGVVPQQAALALRILEAWKYVVQDN